MNTVTGFASGIGVAVFAAFASYLLQRHSERRRNREHAAFRVYMLLLELNEYYFGVASNELHGEPPPPGIAATLRGLAGQIANKLREADDIPNLEEVLTVLMCEDAYRTAHERAEALNSVIDRIGDTVNRRYTKLVRGISDRNVAGSIDRPSGHRNNAPYLMS